MSPNIAVKKRQPTVQTILQRQTISYSQNNCYVVLPGLSTWFLTHFWISKMTDLKTIHYCQGKKASGSSYCRKIWWTACNQSSCGIIMEVLQTLKAIKKRRIFWISTEDINLYSLLRAYSFIKPPRKLAWIKQHALIQETVHPMFSQSPVFLRVYQDYK